MPNAPRRYQPHKQPQRKPWQQTRGTNKERGYSTDWNKLRNAYIAEHPLCERCEAQGHITEAKEVHHKEQFQGIDDPLRLDPNNLESICISCHRIREHERRRQPTKKGTLWIITGPPGSGKTTWVDQHKKAGDVVFDFDIIAHAMGAPIYDTPTHLIKPIEAMRTILLNQEIEQDTWIIYSDYYTAVRAGGQLKVIDTPQETCIERLRRENRPRLEQRIQKVHTWWEQYGRHIVTHQ